ncbi:hypothetical protein AB9G23_09580 [Francisella philomiragia]|uniref:hypothetical protein n=1 Tax=Francisella philomiragia TaxID=28110 RepID=UPI001902C2A4|nr:hypothetical protein [Francisella philomiragia]MBK2026190.1 hypothetical protein [Francisella philomiragia]
MTVKQNWTEVKKQLKYCDDKSLLGIIQDLYKLSKENKDYLHLRFLAGNDSSQRDALIKKTIEQINKAWDKVTHDPYGYMGRETIAKVTPVKSHVTNYKKAIGTDDGYVQVLIEYIMDGFFCLENNCAERSDTIVNTINSAFDEIINMIKAEKVSPLSDIQWKRLEAFIGSYYIYDTTFYAYKEWIKKDK